MNRRIRLRIAWVSIMIFCAAAATPAPLSAQLQPPADGAAPEAEALRRDIDNLTLRLIRAQAISDELGSEKLAIEASDKQDAAPPRSLHAKDGLWEDAFGRVPAAAPLGLSAA